MSNYSDLVEYQLASHAGHVYDVDSVMAAADALTKLVYAGKRESFDTEVDQVIDAYIGLRDRDIRVLLFEALIQLQAVQDNNVELIDAISKSFSLGRG